MLGWMLVDAISSLALGTPFAQLALETVEKLFALIFWWMVAPTLVAKLTIAVDVRDAKALLLPLARALCSFALGTYKFSATATAAAG